MNLNEKIIKSNGIHVPYQLFLESIRNMSDKKAHGVDGLPISLLRKIGYQKTYHLFCQWTNKKLNEEENNLLSTARMVFLSKNNQSIAYSHKDYRVLAVQPMFIKILESIVYKDID